MLLYNKGYPHHFESTYQVLTNYRRCCVFSAAKVFGGSFQKKSKLLNSQLLCVQTSVFQAAARFSLAWNTTKADTNIVIYLATCLTLLELSPRWPKTWARANPTCRADQCARCVRTASLTSPTANNMCTYIRLLLWASHFYKIWTQSLA